MADSLGEGSEGVIFDQILTRSYPILKSHQLEFEVGLTLCCPGAPLWSPNSLPSPFSSDNESAHV